MPFRALIWIPDVGTRTEHSPPFLRKDPFLAPSNSGCYGLLGSMVYSRCEGTKPLSHPVKVAREGRMYGEGRAAVVPDEMSLLRWPRSGDWQVATHSTADRPGGLWGSYILDHVWISVFVTIAGYVECLGEQEGYRRISFYRFELLLKWHQIWPVEGAVHNRCVT